MKLSVLLIIPITGLKVLAFNQPNVAQSPQLDAVALQQMAMLTKVEPSALTVVNSAKIKYQRLGKTAFKFKILEKRSGTVYEVNLDSSGRQISLAQLQADEQAIAGKIAPMLAKKLTSVQKPIKVILWLKEPRVVEIGNPHAQVDAQRARKIKLIVDAVASKLKNLSFSVQTEKYAPVIYASLTPNAIAQVAKWNAVDKIYEVRQVQPALDMIHRVVRSNTVSDRGITGKGVRVALLEFGGRVASNNPYLQGIVQDTTYISPFPIYHTTNVAGILRSTHPQFRGIASGVLLWIGGSEQGQIDQLQARSTAAAAWGAQIFNLSFGGDSSGKVEGLARFYDDMVINRRRTIVVAGGNYGAPDCTQGTSGNVATPALAYNVISVGSFDDQNTRNWGDDKMYRCSSWRNPISTHSDRQKPEVVAPGTGIMSTITSKPWIGATGAGTSFSAPIVTGIAALMIQRDRTIASFPEAIKAILMTTAVNNIEGSTRLSEYDGAGGVVADKADDLVRKINGNWGGQSYSCDAATQLNVATMSLIAGKRTRAAIVWNNNPAYANYDMQPSADLNLQIVDPVNKVVAGSYSWDNTYEIVDFTPTSTGNYKLRINKNRCDLTPRWLGWAWQKIKVQGTVDR